MLVMVTAGVAAAQVCHEPNSPPAGKANMDCDMSYRSQVVSCDKVNPASTTEIVGTRPSCPPKPMPMIDTPKKSYMTGYSPYLWQYPRDASDQGLPYSGTYGLGTPGDSSRTFQLFGNTAPGTKRLASCTTQIKLPSNPTSQQDWARLIRLQADNCANQYLLYSAMYPAQKGTALTPSLYAPQPGNSQILSGDDPTRPGLPLTLDTECQPLNVYRVPSNEYSASTYIAAAWKKLLQDPTYRKTTSAVKCTPCVGLLSSLGLPCDHEPHLPCGITLDHPMPPPNELETPPKPFPEVLLSTISTVKFEDINDPTHPFSPRWDYLLNDRDYSNISFTSLGSFSTTALAIQGSLAIYMNPLKNSVFCAGVRNSTETDPQKKDDDEVKVDVLTFRQKTFEDALTKRAGYNAACYLDQFVPRPLIAYDLAGWAETLVTYCYQVKWTGSIPLLMPPPYFMFTFEDCWKCFKLSGQVDDEGPAPQNGQPYNNGHHPPCTTTYLGQDLTIDSNWRPGGLNGNKRPANCGTPMPLICKNLRAPYTNLNKLKMRYHNPNDPDDTNGDNVVLKDGALEGMTFKEYFGNHMPYPIIWDLGQSLQRTETHDANDQPANDTTGQYTAIVGVGREAAAKVASDAAPADSNGVKAADKYTDQRCKTMGWGLPATFAGVSITLPDPVTSWTELKLYEAHTMNKVGLSCIARYEKVFKPGAAENMMLNISGGEIQQPTVSKCTRQPHGRTSNCTYMTWPQYVAAGSPPDDASTVYLKQLNQVALPLGWRGYLSAADSNNKFPNFGGAAGGGTVGGLDNAQPGDIILMPNGPGNNAAAPGLAKMAYVIEAHTSKTTSNTTNGDCETSKSCFVRVFEPDDGKWPDICGTTDTWGQMKTRYYFKPGELPPEASAEYTKIHSIGTCEETKISHCEQTAWSSLQLYRPSQDVRTGCDKSNATQCN